jgi:uncharacterized protein with NRDE domain
MCLLSIAYKVHPDYPLVFIGNRDEYHARPTAAADWWADQPDLLGGRDLQAGGSWLGINRAGQLGVVTNRPALPPPATVPLSRGGLVTSWLTDKSAIEQLPTTHNRYGGFSLLLTSQQSLQLYSGGHGAPELVSRTLDAGVTGLSNTAPDDPWPKLNWLNQQLRDHLIECAPDTNHLLSLLTRGEPIPGQEDAAAVPTTPFISGDVYGTRCSTVVTIDRNGSCSFREWRFGPGGSPSGESNYQFTVRA